MKSWAYAIDADGHAARLSLGEVSEIGEAALVWLHIDGKDPDCRAWLETGLGLPNAIIEAMQAVETRPRATPIDGGVFVNLRGVNSNPDADPEDLVSIRLWAEAGRVVTINYRPLMALADMCARVEAGWVLDPGDFIAILADVLTTRLDPVISNLDDVLDTLEEDIIDETASDLRARIGRVRRSAIMLRRYISPQREALAGLITERLPIFEDSDRLQLAEAANRVLRMTEELDAARERATVLTDQLSDLRAEAVAQRTLLLSVVSSIFLPLTFFTGLIGMNVAGIPFHDRPWAFGAITAANLAFALALLWWFRRRGWF